MNTIQMEYFTVLASTLSYTKAAEILNISQPTLSKAIRHLEDEAGFPLVQKHGRGIILTPQGRTFLPFVRRSLRELNKGIDAVCMEKDVIRVGCVQAATQNLPALVGSIHSVSENSYIQVINGISSDLISSLRNHDLDLIFCTATDEYSDITFTPLLEHRLYVCVYPSHPLAKKKECGIEVLEHENIVSHSTGSVLHRFYTRMLDDKGIRTHIVAEADEDSHVAALVQQKLGISVISTDDPHRFPGVVMIPLVQDRIRRMLSVGWRVQDENIEPFIKAIIRDCAKNDYGKE